MKAKFVLVVFALSSLLILVGCSPGGFNPKDEQRFTVGNQTYAVTSGSVSDGMVEVYLERREPAGKIRHQDADAIMGVEGVVLTSNQGDRVPLSEARLEPDAGELQQGLVVLVFEAEKESFFSKTWTMEWPGHDSMVVSRPE